MPLIAQRIARGMMPFLNPYLTPATRTRPEKIILGVRPGHRPSDKPPVRIFLGSEREQFRAERVFIWSVERNRDPSRIYEIHLLKGLKGYISGFWITGFTNYRFAIPDFCNYSGRAIYNDVDQVWLTDPAELFDRDMDGAGFLSINERDTSVMLIDCKRMAGIWNRRSVTGTTRKRIESRARAAGLWGPMQGRYNARDAEYVPGESACVHFTTLHTQPWRPFPDWFVYHDNPTGSLWFDLEREADSARFLPVSALRPSSAWPDSALAISALPDGPELAPVLAAREDGLEVAPSRRIRGLLERVPDADLPWVLDRLFRYSRELALELGEPIVIRRGRPRRSLHFWIQQLRLAERLNPSTRWRLERRVGPTRRVVSGGPLPDGPIAILAGPGGNRCDDLANEAAIEGLAAALARATDRRVVHARSIDELGPGAAPAILIAAGRGACRAARAYIRRADPAPGLVLAGHDAGPVPEHRGAVISMAHHRLPPHPNRITALLGPGPAVAAKPAETPGWKSWRTAARRAALIVGRHPEGRNWSRTELAGLLDEAREWAGGRNARLLVLTTPESASAGPVLDRLVGEGPDPRPEIDCRRADDNRNPYALVIEMANALLVAGGTQTLMREVLSSSAAVYLVPCPGRRRLTTRIRRALARRIAARAFRPEYNRRGSIRPQQGMTYLCARLVEQGRVLPPADFGDWQKAIVERGLAAWLGSDAVPAGVYKDETAELSGAILARLTLQEQPVPTGRHSSGTR